MYFYLLGTPESSNLLMPFCPSSAQLWFLPFGKGRELCQLLPTRPSSFKNYWSTFPPYQKPDSQTQHYNWRLVLSQKVGVSLNFFFQFLLTITEWAKCFPLTSDIFQVNHLEHYFPLQISFFHYLKNTC